MSSHWIGQFQSQLVVTCAWGSRAGGGFSNRSWENKVEVQLEMEDKGEGLPVFLRHAPNGRPFRLLEKFLLQVYREYLYLYVERKEREREGDRNSQ